MSADGLTFSTVSGAAAFADSALETISAARHQISLMSVDLPRAVFGTEAFLERLRAFVIGHRRANLRVLVHDPAGAVRNSVRLVEFGRLLSSRVEFRAVPTTKRVQRDEYLIADERTVLHRGSPDQIDAKFYSDAPMVARSQLRSFEAIWQDATVARELSSLRL